MNTEIKRPVSTFEERHNDILKLQYYIAINRGNNIKFDSDEILKIGQKILIDGIRLEDILLDLAFKGQIDME